MGQVLLVRHGQASFGADDYDVLSDRAGRRAGRSVRGWPRTASPPRWWCGATCAAPRDRRGAARRRRLGGAGGGGRRVGRVRPPRRGGPRSRPAAAAVPTEDRRAFQRLFEVATGRWSAGEHDAEYPESFSAFVAVSTGRWPGPAIARGRWWWSAPAGRSRRRAPRWSRRDGRDGAGGRLGRHTRDAVAALQHRAGQRRRDAGARRTHRPAAADLQRALAPDGRDADLPLSNLGRLPARRAACLTHDRPGHRRLRRAPRSVTGTTTPTAMDERPVEGCRRGSGRSASRATARSTAVTAVPTRRSTCTPTRTPTGRARSSVAKSRGGCSARTCAPRPRRQRRPDRGAMADRRRAPGGPPAADTLPRPGALRMGLDDSTCVFNATGGAVPSAGCSRPARSPPATRWSSSAAGSRGDRDPGGPRNDRRPARGCWSPAWCWYPGCATGRSGLPSVSDESVDGVLDG